MAYVRGLWIKSQTNRERFHGFHLRILSFEMKKIRYYQKLKYHRNYSNSGNRKYFLIYHRIELINTYKHNLIFLILCMLKFVDNLLVFQYLAFSLAYRVCFAIKIDQVDQHYYCVTMSI